MHFPPPIPRPSPVIYTLFSRPSSAFSSLPPSFRPPALPPSLNPPHALLSSLHALSSSLPPSTPAFPLSFCFSTPSLPPSTPPSAPPSSAPTRSHTRAGRVGGQRLSRRHTASIPALREQQDAALVADFLFRVHTALHVPLAPLGELFRVHLGRVFSVSTHVLLRCYFLTFVWVGHWRALRSHFVGALCVEGSERSEFPPAGRGRAQGVGRGPLHERGVEGRGQVPPARGLSTTGMRERGRGKEGGGIRAQHSPLLFLSLSGSTSFCKFRFPNSFRLGGMQQAADVRTQTPAHTHAHGHAHARLKPLHPPPDPKDD